MEISINTETMSATSFYQVIRDLTDEFFWRHGKTYAHNLSLRIGHCCSEMGLCEDCSVMAIEQSRYAAYMRLLEREITHKATTATEIEQIYKHIKP
jgi:hypothetical protein